MRGADSGSAFLKLLKPSVWASGWLIEVEGLGGKLCTHRKGVTGAELAGFSRAMWESSDSGTASDARIFVVIQAVDLRKGID